MKYHGRRNLDAYLIPRSIQQLLAIPQRGQTEGAELTIFRSSDEHDGGSDSRILSDREREKGSLEGIGLDGRARKRRRSSFEAEALRKRQTSA